MVSKLVELIEIANGKMREAEGALELSKQSLAAAETAKHQAEVARSEGVLQIAGQIGAVIDELALAINALSQETAGTGG